MTRIQAHFRVVTPLFLAGYDQSTAELRVPSIKGVLRFWWRALAWQHFRDLKKLSEAEELLFGSNQQQSAVMLRLISPPQLQVVSDASGWNKPGHVYLGYGLLKFDGTVEKTRKLVKPPVEFTLNLLIKPSAQLQREPYRNQLLEAIKLMGLLGGLGSRTRRGYGSLTLMSLLVNGEEVFQAPSSVEQFKAELSKIVEPLRTKGRDEGDLPYTAIGPRSRFILVDTQGSAADAHNWLGKELLEFRSWGRDKGDVHRTSTDSVAEQNFPIDHDIAYHQWRKSISRNVSGLHPQRIVFGTPHNYFKSPNLKLKVQSQPTREHRMVESRRASPLMFHVHQAAKDGPAIGVIAFLPAQFFPEDHEVIIQVGNASGVRVPLQEATLWDPIIGTVVNAKGETKPGFLQRIQNKGGVLL